MTKDELKLVKAIKQLWLHLQFTF